MGLLAVKRMTFRLDIEALRIARQHIGKFVVITGGKIRIFEPFVVTPENQRPAGVLFLGQAVEIGRIADLRLDLFLAVAEIIVGDQRDDDAPLVARTNLEGITVVVKFVVALVAHAVAALPLGGVIPMRQPQQMLRHMGQMRRENHAAGVPGPAIGIERGIVLRQIGVSPITKDAFNKIEVRHQSSGNEETDLHAFFGGKPGHGRDNERAQQQRNETAARLGRVGRIRQPQGIFRRIQRNREQFGKSDFRYRQLVVRDRHAALGDMEYAGCRAPIFGRVVQDTIAQAVTRQQRRPEDISIAWQGQAAGQARLIEHQRSSWQRGHAPGIGQIFLEKALNSSIGRAQPVRESPTHFALACQNRRDQARN